MVVASDFVRPKSKKSLLGHLKSADSETVRRWRQDAIDAFVSHEELISWSDEGGIDHGDLGGLTDDDHTQYLLADGTRPLTADWDAGSFQIRAETFRSDVATGTAPLTVASTTVVSNLNSDLLDGQEGSYYLDSDNFTGTEWVDLTDGGDTILHDHADCFHSDRDSEFVALTDSAITLSDIMVYEDDSSVAPQYQKRKGTVHDFNAAMDHGNLQGRGDDDHPHYLLRSDWLENGFVDRTDTTLAWDDGTRTLTLSPAVDDYEYFYAGIRYTEDGDLAATITDTEGLWVFYIGSGGAASLSTIHNPSYEEVEQAILDECIVAYVYWDATKNDGRLMNERHGYVLGRGIHHYLHELFGSQYVSGLTVGDVVADENGTSDSHAQFSITAGEFYDEDIGHDILAHASTDTWECYYVNGSGYVRWVDCEATFPVYAIGGVIAYNNAGTLTAVPSNKYICYHVFATNIHTDAGGDYYPVVTPGTAVHNSKADAQDAALTEIQGIDFGDWPKEEVIPIATVIYQHGAAMTNGVEAAIVSTEGGGDFIDWRFTAVSGSSTSVNDHGALSGLADDDHTQYLLADGTRTLTADWAAGNYEINSKRLKTEATLCDNFGGFNNNTIFDLISWDPTTDGDHLSIDTNIVVHIEYTVLGATRYYDTAFSLKTVAQQYGATSTKGTVSSLLNQTTTHTTGVLPTVSITPAIATGANEVKLRMTINMSAGGTFVSGAITHYSQVNDKNSRNITFY